MRDRDLDRVHGHHREVVGVLAGDVFRQLEQHRAGPLLHSDPERVAHQRRDAARADDLAGQLGQGTERAHHIHDLEARLRLVWMPFCPVIITMGIAPSSA
jgi:hypothetical protein